MDFIGYLFWGGMVLALSAGVLLTASSLIAKVQDPSRSARLRKNLSIGTSVLAGVIILSAGLVAATSFLPYAPPPPRELEQLQPDRPSGGGTPPFGRWDEESIPAGAKQAFPGQKVSSASFTVPAFAQPWPHTPPKIGKLKLKQKYWEYIKEAAQRHHISPYLILAICAIESRYEPDARSGRGSCIGLMQLHKDTARKYGVNPYNPRENIMGGTAVLANLMGRFNGDIHSVLHKYNATCTPAYEREVIRAYNQANQFAMVSLEEKGH
jgi:soluble lytic murein transglycosylase-like protein